MTISDGKTVDESSAAPVENGAAVVHVCIGGRQRAVILPTDEEDAAITAAALDDPDNPPLAVGDGAQFRRASRRFHGQMAEDVSEVPKTTRGK